MKKREKRTRVLRSDNSENVTVDIKGKRKHIKKHKYIILMLKRCGVQIKTKTLHGKKIF